MRNHVLITESLILAIFIYLIRIAFSFYDNNIEEAISINCILAIIVYVWLFYCCLKNTDQYVNIYSLFLLLSFFFYYGQHLVVLMGKSNVLLENYRSILDHRVPNENRINAGYFVLIVMLIVNMGFLTVKQTVKTSYNGIARSRKKNLLLNSYTARIALIVFVIVIIPTFIRYIDSAINTQAMGYSDSMEENESASGFMLVCGFLSYYFLPTLYMLIIHNAQSKKLYILVLIYLLFAVIYMGTGSRFRLFESIIALLLIYNYKIRKIEKKDLIKLAIAGIAILTIFSIVRESRESVIMSGGDPLMALSYILEGVYEKGLFTGALIEMGSTFQVIDIVFYSCPDKVPYINGFSLLGSIFIALPSFLRPEINMDVFSVSKIFSPIYFSEFKIGMGSSFIAEGFYNFGFLSLLYFFFIGKLLGILLRRTNSNTKTNLNIKLYRYIYVSSILCFGVRTDLVSYLRYYLYYVVFFEVIIYWIYRVRIKRA